MTEPRELREQFLRAVDELIDAAKEFERACDFVDATADALREGAPAVDEMGMEFIALGTPEARDGMAFMRRVLEGRRRQLAAELRRLVPD